MQFLICGTKKINKFRLSFCEKDGVTNGKSKRHRVQKSEIAYAIQKYNKSTIYSYGDFCPSYLDTYMTYDTECDPISFCKFVMENLEEKVRDNEGLPIPMIVIYTNLDDLVKITVIENYIKEMENEKLVGNVVFMTR